MTSAFAVDSQPTQILTAYRKKPTIVINMDNSSVVYLGDDSTLSMGRGIPLYPGFGISWDKDIPMWACTGINVATIVISDMEGTIFNARDLN